LKMRQDFLDWLDTAMSKTPVREAPFNFAVAREAARIRLPEPDPGDVFLAATTVVFQLVLVTADKQLLDCSWLPTMRAD
jgi:PIN domain nuclease of toxin-antitoxin system